MHPILGQGRRLALYLGTWVLVGALVAQQLASQADLDWIAALAAGLPLALVYAFVCLSAWYVARGMPLSATGAIRIVTSAFAAAALSSAGWVAIARLWLTALISRRWIPRDTEAAGDALFFGLGVLLYLLSLAVSYLLATFEATRETERRALQVQVHAREAELRTLRAQIDPHFLFNSLQSISALTTADPAGARRMCLLLADFLRESLALGAETRIPLGRELQLAQRFLDIERVRFGTRLQVQIEPNDAGGCLVPPLLLQPIVENAVVHGVAHALEGGTVRVEAARRGRHVMIVVENPCDPDRPRGRRRGVGLANVRGRLAALYPSEAAMQTKEEGGIWRVELLLPAATAGESQ
jgi:signal transduction histidine kinase